MPNPTPGAVHVDSLLTDISVAFIQSSTKYVADRVFPRIPVQKQSDLFATYSRADFLRDEIFVRQAGSAPNRIGYRTGTDSYIAKEWAAEHAIDDQVRANAQAPYMPEEDAVRFLTQKMLLKREKEFVNGYFTANNLWTGSSDGADLVGGTDFTQWSNAASTPIEDIHRAMTRMEERSGILPNTLVVNRQVWFDLKNHPDIVDRIKYTSAESVTTDIVARFFGLDQVLVAAAVENTNAEGLAHSGRYIVGDNALLVYSPPNPGLMQPASGYTFVWSGLIGAAEGQVIETYREDQTVSDIIRIRSAWAQKIVASDLGIMYTNASTNA